MHKSNSLLIFVPGRKSKDSNVLNMWLKVPVEQYKKIKSQGRKVFIINEFIIERILFFGKNTNGVKQSRVKKKLYKYKLNSNVKIVL
jgi:hypothetical protein